MHICLSFSTRKSSMQSFPTSFFTSSLLAENQMPSCLLWQAVEGYDWAPPFSFFVTFTVVIKPWSCLYVFLFCEFLWNHIVDITALGMYCQNLIIWCLCHIITYSFQSLLIIGSYCVCNHIFITCLWHLSLSAKHLLKWHGTQ